MALDKLQEKLAHQKRTLMEACGDALVSGTLKRFDEEKDPEGKAWEPSARAWEKGLGHAARKATKNRKGRRFKAASGNYGKTLTDTARLRNSIDSAVAGDTVFVGSTVKYARIHQMGGMAGKGRKVKIPARPYLGVGEEDREEVIETIREFLAGTLKSD
jgi:phage virion morphogenesis protein